VPSDHDRIPILGVKRLVIRYLLKNDILSLDDNDTIGKTFRIDPGLVHTAAYGLMYDDEMLEDTGWAKLRIKEEKRVEALLRYG
jgi:hypothetical protein